MVKKLRSKANNNRLISAKHYITFTFYKNFNFSSLTFSTQTSFLASIRYEIASTKAGVCLQRKVGPATWALSHHRDPESRKFQMLSCGFCQEVGGEKSRSGQKNELYKRSNHGAVLSVLITSGIK